MGGGLVVFSSYEIVGVVVLCNIWSLYKERKKMAKIWLRKRLMVPRHEGCYVADGVLCHGINQRSRLVL